MKSTRSKSTTNNKNYLHKSEKPLPASIDQINNDTYNIVTILVEKKFKHLCFKLKLDLTQYRKRSLSDWSDRLLFLPYIRQKLDYYLTFGVVEAEPNRH